MTEYWFEIEMNKQAAQIRQLEKQNRDLVAALEYYANPDIYIRNSKWVHKTEAEADEGLIAQQALAQCNCREGLDK